ncbi:MAG: RNA polymerase sigma factor SigJ [Sandaracinaceae bacterium]
MTAPAALDTKRLREARPHLFAVAYRMLGSAADAEDAVQEALLRLAALPAPEEVRSVDAFLTTVVTRVCLDRLKSAQRRRERYVGPWLPEPVCTEGDSDPGDPRAISFAFLVLLEALSPLERAAFLLHDVFDYAYPDVAEVLSREVAAVRQLVRRARGHLRDGRPRFAPSREAHERVLHAFVGAVATGDLEGLTALLAEDVVSHSDGGGKVKSALKVLRGADRVARFLIGTQQRFGANRTPRFVDLNGWPGLVLEEDGRPVGALSVETDGERVLAVHVQLNPDKLAYV